MTPPRMPPDNAMQEAALIDALKHIGQRIEALPSGVSGYLLPMPEGVGFVPVVGNTVRDLPSFVITWEALSDPAASRRFVDRYFDKFVSVAPLAAAIVAAAKEAALDRDSSPDEAGGQVPAP